MTLEKALGRIVIEYEKAKRSEWVWNPLAYALYKVWKEVDANGKS